MPLNFELAGKTYPPTTIEISPDSIAAYARASRIDNRQHAVGDQQVPSVVYPVVGGLGLMAAVGGDPELGLDNPLMILHGEHEIIHHRPMRPGETLVFTPSLEAVVDKGLHATYLVKVTAATPDGDVVNEQTGLMLVRGAGSGEDLPKGDKPPPPARHDEEARFTSHVDEAMPGEYAEASGDRNPIHTDPEVAKAVGLPGVINHGLGTLSLVSGGLVDSVAGGDATRVRRLQARFTEMVIPGGDLTTTVWRSDGDAHVFETRGEDDSVVVVGLVEVIPA